MWNVSSQRQDKNFDGTGKPSSGVSHFYDPSTVTSRTDFAIYTQPQLHVSDSGESADTFSGLPLVNSLNSDSDSSFEIYYEDGSEPSFSFLDIQDQEIKLEDGTLVNFSSSLFAGGVLYPETGNGSSLPDYELVSPGRGVALAFFVLIFLVGMVGNAMVIYTIAKYMTVRRVTYLYLMNLSIANVLYLLVCLPTLSVSYALVDWPFGKVFCKLENYVMSVSMSVSVFTIMATGFDRYLAIMYPVQSRGFRTTKKAVSVICLIWVISLIIMAPRISIFDEIQVFHIIEVTTICSRVASGRSLQLDTAFNFIFLYLLPLLVLSVCHFCIGRKLWRRTRPGNRVIHSRILSMQDSQRTAKIIFAITIVFAIGWLPIHVYHLVEDFDQGNVFLGNLLDRGTVALLFSFGANALHPIFYCFCSSSISIFRKSFRTVFRCVPSRVATSLDAGNLASSRRQADPTNQQENPRPPSVLLPRPASILPELELLSSHPFVLAGEADTILTHSTSTCSVPPLYLKPLLQTPSQLQSRPDLPTDTTAKLSHAEVSKFNSAFDNKESWSLTYPAYIHYQSCRLHRSTSRPRERRLSLSSSQFSETHQRQACKVKPRPKSFAHFGLDLALSSDILHCTRVESKSSCEQSTNLCSSKYFYRRDVDTNRFQTCRCSQLKDLTLHAGPSSMNLTKKTIRDVSIPLRHDLNKNSVSTSDCESKPDSSFTNNTHSQICNVSRGPIQQQQMSPLLISSSTRTKYSHSYGTLSFLKNDISTLTPSRTEKKQKKMTPLSGSSPTKSLASPYVRRYLVTHADASRKLSPVNEQSEVATNSGRNCPKKNDLPPVD